jgi:protein FRA10AC1
MCADFDSNFETESETEIQRKSKRKDLTEDKSLSQNKKQKASKCDLIEEYNKEERKRRTHFLSLDAYSRHKMLVNEYILSYSGSTSKLARDESKDKTEYEILRDNHQFIWSEDQELVSWGQRIAKKYYDQLFKEYCISDMSRFKENKFGMRWRTEQEVIEGKGQFSCGAKHCSQTESLKSWEVLFAYVESGIKKNALVKLRLCEECSIKLNYRQKRNEAKKKKRNKDLKNETKLNSETFLQKVDNNSDQKDFSLSNNNLNSDQNDSAMTSSSSEIWSKPQKIDDFEKPIDDEFDDYLADLLQ